MTTDNFSLRRLGKADLTVSSVCVGGSPLGGMPLLYGHDVEAETAIDLVEAAFDSPFRFLDTSNGYSEGESERRIGEAIRRRGGLPDNYVLATKVDPDFATGDYSGERVRASAQESLERLGQEKFQLLHLHDPEWISFEEAMAPGGPVETLIALKNEGVADNIGVAGGLVSEITKYVETGLFDVLLTHNRYTLLSREAEPLIDAAVARGMGVINAAPYGGGMLVKGPEVTQKYAYMPAQENLLTRAHAIHDVCKRFGVPLAAAALQFSIRDPRIHSTVVGMSQASRIQQTVDYLSVDIPDELWDELEQHRPAGE